MKPLAQFAANLPLVPGDDGVTRPTANGWKSKAREPAWWALYQARLWPDRPSVLEHLAERGFSETEDPRWFIGMGTAFAIVVEGGKNGRYHLSEFAGNGSGPRDARPTAAPEAPQSADVAVPTDRRGQYSLL